MTHVFLQKMHDFCGLKLQKSMVDCGAERHNKNGSRMNAVVAIYATLAVSYLFGGLLHKRVPSTSYILFISLIAIWSFFFVISYEVLTLAKFRAFATPGNFDDNLVFASNFLNTFVLGVSLSLLVTSRAKYLTEIRWLKVVLWLPVIHLATLMIGMGKQNIPQWRVNKWNVTTIATALLALTFVRPGVGEAVRQKEVEYQQEQRQEFARLVAEEVSRNQPFPYAYDVDELLLLNGISSSGGIITLELSESQSNLLAWDSIPLNQWFGEMLCDQWRNFNVRPTQPYEIEVSFIVSDFAGSNKWQMTATRQLCSQN